MTFFTARLISPPERLVRDIVTKHWYHDELIGVP